MENSNEEGNMYQHITIDLEKEVVPGVTMGEFMNMTTEKKQEILNTLKEQDPVFAEENESYFNSIKSNIPSFAERFKNK